MECDYYDRRVCRSCTLMGVPYPTQLAAKARRCEAMLATVAAGVVWLPPVPSREEGFRAKAKLVVGGVPGSPTLGILDEHGRGVDLRRCGLHEPPIRDSLGEIAQVIAELGLVPYDVTRRKGELKHLVVTAAPSGELMLRFVLRSPGTIPRIRRALPHLLARVPRIAVVSANIQPRHAAVIDGDTEIVLTEREHLDLPLGEVTLHVRPRSFVQTNTEIAVAMYRQARVWADRLSLALVWDLYCGVGGFALHLAAPGRRVVGVEASPEAVDGARSAAADRPVGASPGTASGQVEVVVADAAAYAASTRPAPDLLVVNPPRRGLPPELAGWLDTAPVRWLVYSSCNPDTLARDLGLLTTWRAREARVFDMFPQTEHLEAMVLLEHCGTPRRS